MELSGVREELDKIDNVIKNLLVIRMSLIPHVAEIKIKNNLGLFQSKREEEIYRKINEFCSEKGVSYDLVKEIYYNIIKNALEIEHNIKDGETPYELDVKFDSNTEEQLLEKYKELDTLLVELPNILKDINDIGNQSENKYNLSEISTAAYKIKLNK